MFHRLNSRAGAAWKVGCLLALTLFAGFLQSSQAASSLNIRLLSTNRPPEASSGFGDVWAEGNLACLGVWTAYNTFGFAVYDISNPSAPNRLTTYNWSATVQNRFEQGVIRNQILYIGCWGGSSNGSGLHIYSLTNPASPLLLSRITRATAGTVTGGFDDVHTLFLERNYLYEAAHNFGFTMVRVFDVSNPSAPFFIRQINTTNTTKVHQMTVRNKGASVILYTSGWGGNDNGVTSSPGQTDMWDVSNVGSQQPTWLGRVYAGYNSHSSWPTADGNTLVVCREMPGGDVKLYDTTNPGTITSNTPPLVTITPASMGIEADIPHNPVVVSNYLFLSWYQNGIQVFDISDRTKPVRIGFYDTYPLANSSSYQGNWGIFPHLGFDKVLLSDIQGGLFIVDASAVLIPTNNYPPMIVSSPASLTATQGLSAVLTPVITGSLLRYQWWFNSTNLLAAMTNSVLTLNNVQLNQAGSYLVVASNATAVVTSSVAVLSVVVPTGLAPGISSQPVNTSVYQGNPAVFNVGVTGAPTMYYQWRLNGNAIAGATNASFQIAETQPNDVGYYSVQITNAYGSATSSNALLILQDSPYLSGVSSSPGSRGALVSWTTTVPGNSQVQFDSATTVIPGPASAAAAAQGNFSSMSYTDPEITTNHVILLSGLSPDTLYSFQTLSSNGTNTYLSGVYQFTTTGTNIIDNPLVTTTGSWTTATSSTDKYLTNYIYATSTSGSANAIATWRPTITTPGKYNVYVWYPQGSNRASNAPYTIAYNGGTITVLVNQQSGGGAWQQIGTNLDFAKGTSGYVRLGNNANNSVVIADAVRFVYVETQDFPTGPTVPAWWQNFYFASSPNLASDPDNDAFTIAQEYVTGTVPLNGNSRLQYSVQPVNNGTLQVTFWPILGNRLYQLLYTTDPASGNWQPTATGPVVPTVDGHGIFSIPATNTPGIFYRLSVQMSTNASFSGSIAVPPSKALVPFGADPICAPNRIYYK